MAVEVVWTIVIPLDALGVHKVLAPCGVVRFVLAMSPLKQFRIGLYRQVKHFPRQFHLHGLLVVHCPLEPSLLL